MTKLTLLNAPDSTSPYYLLQSNTSWRDL